MKGWIKGLLIFVVVLFAVGIGCLVVAFGMGVPSEEARTTVEKYLDYFDIFDIIKDKVWDNDSDDFDDVLDDMDDDLDDINDGEDSFETDSEQDMSDAKVYEYPVEDIENLELDFKKADVKILSSEKGKEDKIVVKLDKGSVNRFKEKCKNRTLELEYSTTKTNKHTAGVEIYLPDGVQWKSVEVSLGAGTIDVQNPAGLYADSLDLEIGGGVLYVDYIQGKKLNVELGAGEINLDYVDMENVEIEVGLGQANVCVLGTKDMYQSDIEVAAGEVRFGDEVYSGLVNAHKNHPKDADRKISVECAAGEAIITFKEEI